MGLSGGSSKPLRNAVLLKIRRQWCAPPGEPGSLSFFSTGYNSGSARYRKTFVRREVVNDPKNRTLANLEDCDPAQPLSNPENC
jgi:hypothetical protein